MSQILAICDHEALYVYRLTEYLNRHRLLPFEAMAFSDPHKLKSYAAEHEIAMLIISKEWLWREILEGDGAHVGQVVVFAEERQATEGIPEPGAESIRQSTTEGIPEPGAEQDTTFHHLVEELPRLQRYQSAEQTARDILEICAKHEEKLPIVSGHRGKVQIIGIYSPIGRCLKTSFSLTLGQLLAQDRKCLYINMEPYSGFNGLFGKYYDHNMSELLYFLEKGARRFAYKLKGTIERLGNLEYIPPAESFWELMSIEPKTWSRFIQEIIAQTDYETLILDLSDYVSGLLPLLSMCDHIFTITRKDGVAMAKLDQYEKMLSYSHQDAILGKMRKFQFPIFKELPKQMEQLPYSELADYTRKLIQEEKL